MARERQVSFHGGELSPHLWGRTDLDVYAAGARTLRNFCVTQEGVVRNRPGTTRLAAIPDGLQGRLLTGEMPDGSSLSLLLVPGALYEVQRAVIVADWISGGLSLISTTSLWNSWAEIEAMRFAQLGNTIYIAGGVYPIAMTYTGSTWDISQFSTAVDEMPDDHGLCRLQIAPLAAGTTLYAPSGDNLHPPREWSVYVSAVVKDLATQVVTETAARKVSVAWDGTAYTSIPAEMAIYPDFPQRFDLQHAQNHEFAEYVLLEHRVYRGRDGIMGLVGSTREAFFVDDGAEPDYSRPPPRGENPLSQLVGDQETGYYLSEKPHAVCLHNGRLVWGGSDKRPSRIVLSAVDDWHRFDSVLLPLDTDAFEFQIVSSTVERVRDLVPHAEIVALTASGEWLLTGSGESEVMTPNAFAARRISSFGSSGPPALVVDDMVVFVDARGNPRAISRGDGGYVTRDIGSASRHLFDGYGIKSWCAQRPHGLIWAARSDGALLSCAISKDTGIAAWSLHELADDGLVESVACAPNGYGTEDFVLLVVNRSAERTVELLGNRTIQDAISCVFLDRAVRTDCRVDMIGGTLNWEHTGVPGDPVVVTFVSPDGGALTGMFVEVDNGGTPLVVELVSYAAGEYVGNLEPGVTEPTGGARVGVSYRLLTRTVTGLSHLDGTEVEALADGDHITGLVVEGGVVVLPSPAEVAVVGRPYICDLEGLNATHERGRQKIVREVVIELEHSRGGLVGPHPGALVELRTREVGDSYDTLVGKRVDVRMLVRDKWGEQGRYALRHNTPTPLTVLGVSREFEYGGE